MCSKPQVFPSSGSGPDASRVKPRGLRAFAANAPDCSQHRSRPSCVHSVTSLKARDLRDCPAPRPSSLPAGPVAASAGAALHARGANSSTPRRFRPRRLDRAAGVGGAGRCNGPNSRSQSDPGPVGHQPKYLDCQKATERDCADRAPDGRPAVAERPRVSASVRRTRDFRKRINASLEENPESRSAVRWRGAYRMAPPWSRNASSDTPRTCHARFRDPRRRWGLLVDLAGSRAATLR